MRPLFFSLLLLVLLAACAKVSAPLKLFFTGSARFVAGSRTITTTDTLSARIYADDTAADPQGLTHLNITVDYAPRLTPFLYPTPLTQFLPSSVQPSTAQVIYLDSLFAPGARPTELLYTTVFGPRSTVGTERWTFTVADQAGSTSSRTFTLSQRRSDSTEIYNDYLLQLNLLAGATNQRRFIDLKSGLAVPGFTALNPTNADLQQLLDAVLLPNGSLASPDYFASSGTLPLSTTKWPTTRRHSTRFSLTSLNDVTFLTQDTIAFRNLFQPIQATSLISGLTAKQVYAFRLIGVAATPTTAGVPDRYGLLLVASTTSGLRLRVRVTKQRL